MTQQVGEAGISLLLEELCLRFRDSAWNLLT